MIVSKRVFIAIPAGDEVQKVLGDYRRMHRDLSVRWLRPDDLHVTLLAPWICDDIEKVCSLLGDVAEEFSPFEICFDRIAPGPERRRLRLIWASGTAPEELETLYRCIQDRFAAAETGQRRSLRMHVTFARGKDAVLRMVIPERYPPFADLCRRVCLYESCQHSSGARYRKLCCYEFCGERQQQCR